MFLYMYYIQNCDLIFSMDHENAIFTKQFLLFYLWKKKHRVVYAFCPNRYMIWKLRTVSPWSTIRRFYTYCSDEKNISFLLIHFTLIYSGSVIHGENLYYRIYYGLWSITQQIIEYRISSTFSNEYKEYKIYIGQIITYKSIS